MSIPNTELTESVQLARDLLRMTLHGAPPVATTMKIAEALVALAATARKMDGDLAALRIEHALHVDLLAAARREREEARDKPAEVSTALAHEAWADTEIRRIYGAEFGLHQEGDSPPCWEDFANHIRGLTATIENERGEGTGPSGGWEWTGELGGNEWRKREGAPNDDSEPIDLYVRHRETWYEEGTDERPWAWHVAPQLGQGDEAPDIASGEEKTAREAMRAADAALARSGS